MSKKYGVQIKFIKALVKVKDKEESNVEFIDLKGEIILEPFSYLYLLFLKVRFNNKTIF